MSIKEADQFICSMFEKHGPVDLGDSDLEVFLSEDFQLQKLNDPGWSFRGSYPEVKRYCSGGWDPCFCIFLMWMWYGGHDFERVFSGCIRNGVAPTSFLRHIRDRENFSKKVLEIKEDGIDYKKLLEACIVEKRKETKYNIIVPVKGRTEHLKKFLFVMERMLSGRDDWSVTIIFQEETEDLFLQVKDLKPSFNLNLIHLPHSLVSEMYGDNMNRSLCYNVASKLIKCEWQLNHDVDLIFDSKFLDNVENKTDNPDLKWLQPYRGSRVIYMDPTATENVIAQIKEKNKISYSGPVPHLNDTPNTVGAPGGCVCIRWKDFQEIGGYDPEFVWGYAPEDALFWTKLECYHAEDLGSITESDRHPTIHPFIRDDVFSHDSNSELYHMYHPPTQGVAGNKFWNICIQFYIKNIFTTEDCKEWLRISKEVYNANTKCGR